MDTEHVTPVSDATFNQEVLQAGGLVLLDCWAEWCGPCKSLASVLDEVAEAYAGRLKVVKMDVDQNRDTPGRLGIRGIPSLLIFRDGQVVASRAGAMSRPQLAAFVDAHLPG